EIIEPVFQRSLVPSKFGLPLNTAAQTTCPVLLFITVCFFSPLFKYPCPLCEEAKMMLEPYKDKFTLEEIDITLPNHSVWLEKYKYEIPVFHLNGKFLMKHQVDKQKLENHLLNLELQDQLL
uniref:Glutaredoxin-like protein n=1 Tax=Naja naja TaxID=35670 RepID=A0A8C6X0Y2_NAJNA